MNRSKKPFIICIVLSIALIAVCFFLNYYVAKNHINKTFNSDNLDIDTPSEPDYTSSSNSNSDSPNSSDNIISSDTSSTNQNINTSGTSITFDELPSEYKYALDWIWDNRITYENSTSRRNLLFDQLIDGNGTLNYVVRWQSSREITLQQRKNLVGWLEKAINEWNDYLVGYENWPFTHIDVKIVGWAVLDKKCLLDLQADEIVYDNLISPYDSSVDTSNGTETIPNTLPSAPDNISRFYHFVNNTGFNYSGGLDKRFDMYIWATQGFPYMAGCGGDWGQRFSDTVYLAMANDGTGLAVQQHELGHAFGMPDYYGIEGAHDGCPPGGFPDGCVMSDARAITNFDGWQLRYIWTKIKNENGRFDL